MLILPPGLRLDVPECPSRADAGEALARLLCLVSEFPFKGDDHKSSFISSVLTPLARHAFGGPAPWFLIDANTPGSGKGLLVDLAFLIATGRPAATSTFTNDKAELRKVITKLAVEGDEMVVFDNLTGTVGIGLPTEVD
jgi:hypothetical protein